MASEYARTNERESREIINTLRQVQSLLVSGKINSVYQEDVSELYENVKRVLENINSARESLITLEEETIIKTDANFINLRYQLIHRIEKNKIIFSSEIVPALEKLARQVIEDSKQNPPSEEDISNLPPPAPNEKWTVQRVLDTASQFVDQAAKASSIALKAYGLAKALGFVLGFPLP